MRIFGKVQAVLLSSAVLSVAGTVIGPDMSRAANEQSAEPTVEAEDSTYVAPDGNTIVFVRAQSLEDAAAEEAAARSDQFGATYERSELVGEIVHRANNSRGCRFRGQVEYEPGSAPNGTVFVQRVVSQNPLDCRMVFESAWLTPETAEGLGFDVSGLDGVSASDRANNSPVGTQHDNARSNPTDQPVQASSGYSWDGVIKGRTKEIINLDVAKTNSRVKWNSSSTCVTSSWGQSYWWWRSSTFWGRSEQSNSHNGICWRSQSTYGRYVNGVFCATNDTTISHNVQFTAKPNGASAAEWDLTKWGGCSWLLDSEHTYDPN